MSTIYLNKNVRFKCPAGNAVFFKPIGGSAKITIRGATVLVNDCRLSLVGGPRQGQCVPMMNPSTGIPPCTANFDSCHWDETVDNLTISGKTILSSRSSVQCPLFQCYKIKIAPFKPTLRQIDVGRNLFRLSSDSTATELFGQTVGESWQRKDATPETKAMNVGSDLGLTSIPGEGASLSPNEDAPEEKNPVSNQYILCAKNRGEACETCKYLKTSHIPCEENESKNADKLKFNMAADDFECYHKACQVIETLTFAPGLTYSMAHHHLIPVNQCFKENPELVKLANYYRYDINSALNGICLPTATEGYQKQSPETQREVAFHAMRKLKLQWHVGGHQTSVPSVVDARLPKSFKSYKDQVNDMLDKFVHTHFKRTGCLELCYDEKAEKFRENMDAICDKLREQVLRFSENPQDPSVIYVSKMSLYYAFYDELKVYQDVLFKDRREVTDNG